MKMRTPETDHDRLMQERFSEMVRTQREAGHLTVIQAERIENGFIANRALAPPETDYDFQSEIGDWPPEAA